MSDICKVILLGNLVADPEVRYSASGNCVVNMRIATSRWRSDKGEKEATFHRVVVFGKRAETCGTTLVKGSRVYVEGRINVQKYTDKAGVDRWTTDIVVDPYSGCVEFQPTGKGRSESSHAGSSEAGEPAQHRTQAPAATPAPVTQDFDDDIPF